MSPNAFPASKKITVGQEAIEALPIRDVSELYNLQSGVVKVEGGMRGGIPDHEERGLEEVHVRGGRSGEIAYLIDGMYIRNPIFGGIGNGTRLNLFAVQEFDWQPGGFNAEYGDAMSAVSNMHTKSGGQEFSFKESLSRNFQARNFHVTAFAFFVMFVSFPYLKKFLQPKVLKNAYQKCRKYLHVVKF